MAKVLIAPNGRKITHVMVNMTGKARIKDLTTSEYGGVDFGWSETETEKIEGSEDACEYGDKTELYYDEDGNEWEGSHCDLEASGFKLVDEKTSEAVQ